MRGREGEGGSGGRAGWVGARWAWVQDGGSRRGRGMAVHQRQPGPLRLPHLRLLQSHRFERQDTQKLQRWSPVPTVALSPCPAPCLMPPHPRPRPAGRVGQRPRAGGAAGGAAGHDAGGELLAAGRVGTTKERVEGQGEPLTAVSVAMGQRSYGTLLDAPALNRCLSCVSQICRIYEVLPPAAAVAGALGGGRGAAHARGPGVPLRHAQRDDGGWVCTCAWKSHTLLLFN